MKTINKIIVIILYILFSQVYPFVHLHTHEHNDELKVELSLHPPDYPVENHNHEEHKDHSQAHQQDNTQFVGDRNYTPPVKNFKLLICEPLFFYNEINSCKLLFSNQSSLEISLKFPQYEFKKLLPKRAPPVIC